MNWHTLDIASVISKLSSSDAGLTSANAAAALTTNGSNELKGKKKKSAWKIFLEQFKNFMIVVLVAAAIISGIAGDLVDTIIILVIVLLNAVIGFAEEYRAQQTMEALKKLAVSEVNVTRDGQTKRIPSQDLVPGDVVLLETGQIVPADIRLLEIHSLRIEESSLTGESVPVDKTTEPIADEGIPVAERLNIAYKGTKITNGRGTGVVVETGMNTEVGKIAVLLQEENVGTPLQLKMTDFSKKLSYVIIALCIVLFGVGLIRGEAPLNMLLIAISLAVAAIPEALPALVTIALAVGAKRLVKKQVVVRNLHAVETLGSVTFICSDKTGTLTQNKMNVVEVKPAEGLPPSPAADVSFLEWSMAVNQDVLKNEKGEWLGDPTEIAMTSYIDEKHPAGKLEEIQKEYPREREFPFDADRKRMTTIHKFEDGFVAITKGGAGAVTSILDLPEAEQKKLNDEAAEMAGKGIRVLAYAWRKLTEVPSPDKWEDVEQQMVFSGFVGMVDPPRPEAKQAIKECLEAGIRPVMITGDHIETASAIARELGILADDGLAVTGKELAAMSEEELDAKVEHIRVYGRVSPEQKLTIVKALQRKNHFVAMTGDGSNDAPSLKSANIGIAMGITGTDVSKEAASMILLDDNFATIVNAIKEGRRIYDNIRKFVKYIMACNSAEILIIFTAPLIGLPMPLLPIHILWINLVTDGLPGLALAGEKAEKNIMQRPPRPTNESMFSDGIGYHIIWVGILMAAVVLATQAYSIHLKSGHWQTEVFTVILLSQLGHVFAIRSDKEYIFRKGFFTNLPIIGAILLTFILQLGIIYLPFANKIFRTQPLTFKELLICIAISTIIFFAVELEKMLKKLWAKTHRK